MRPALVLLVLLSACATTPLPVTEQSRQQWLERKPQLQALDQWHLRGRVALFLDEDVYNLGLDWIHNARDNSLTLEAALGQGMVRIRRQGNRAELTTAEGETRSADNAEILLRETTGWDIPVEGLEYWIRGLPRPDSEAQPEIDGNGRLLQLRQDGWTIRYLDYSTGSLSDGLPAALPRRIYMKRGRVRIKIVIDQWQKAAASVSDPLFPPFPDYPDFPD